jgi:ubiquinone/menaquinone biosynthesis C-methylase UbiE
MKTLPMVVLRRAPGHKRMGIYTRVVLPRVCDFLMGRALLAKYRKELLASASGDVLEIGFGTGLNLPSYPEHVRKITAIDPNPGMQVRARGRVQETRIEVNQRVGYGEQLPFPGENFDCVVSTFTLCSIDDVTQALGEVFRVLRPGGRFLFLEHGLSQRPGVQKWQRRLNALHVWLTGGCRLDRNIKSLVAAQPFPSVAVEEFDLEKTPRTHGHLYRGVATK